MTSAQQTRWQYESNIIQDLKRIPSSREMVKLLKTRYGLVTTHGTVNTDLKNDLESLSNDTLMNKKESLLTKLEDELDIAHSIAKNGDDDKIRLDAMKTVSKLTVTISNVCAIFQKAQAEVNKEQRPIYRVCIGKPEVVDAKEFDKMEKKENENPKE